MADMHSRDAERVAGWFTEDSRVWIPPCQPVEGKNRIRALFRALFSRYEHISWEVLDILPVGKNRSIHICNSKGKLNGKPEYRNQVITDISFDRQGQIISLSDYFKDTAVFSREPASPMRTDQGSLLLAAD